MEMPFWFDLIVRNFPLLLKGAWMTLQLFLSAASLSFGLGLFFGVISSEEVRVPFLTPAVHFLTFVLRAVPFFVQLLIVYFVFPDLIGINLETFSASVIALGTCSSGYVCQTVRAGLNSIPPSQWEAAFVLGYGKIKALFSIILPQMLRNVLPAFNNELEAILKSTAVLSSIGMLELTRIGMNIVSRELKQPLTVYVVVASFYILMSIALNAVAKRLERQMRKKVRA